MVILNQSGFNGDTRITFSGLIGFISLGMGLLFIIGTVGLVMMNYEMSAIFGILFYGPIGLLMLYLGYKTHHPRLSSWKSRLGFVLLAAAIFGAHFFIMEGFSQGITDRLQTRDIIVWILIELSLVGVGYQGVKILLKTRSSKIGLLVLEVGFIVIASSFSQVFYFKPVTFVALAAIGLIAVTQGYRLMRRIETGEMNPG